MLTDTFIALVGQDAQELLVGWVHNEIFLWYGQIKYKDYKIYKFMAQSIFEWTID